MRLAFWLTLAIVLGTILGFCLREAKADIVEDVLGCSGGPKDPCVITYNLGGRVKKFEAAAAAIKNGARKEVIVDGVCGSACTIVIDEVKQKVCLTSRARLLFHRGTAQFGLLNIGLVLFEFRTDFRYSERIEDWKQSIGGLPRDGSPVQMAPANARAIWKSCPHKLIIHHMALRAHGLY